MSNIAYEEIAKQAIADMTQIANKLNWENGEEIRMELLQVLENLEVTQQSVGTVSPAPIPFTPYIPGQPEGPQPNIEDMSEQELLKIPYYHKFQRDPRGGTILGLDFHGKDFRITEEEVLRLNLSHGDIIHREMNDDPETSYYRFTFSVLRKGNQKNTNRLELTHCPVEELAGRKYVDTSEGKSLARFGLPESALIYINNFDINDFQIRTGDLIDIAIDTNQPQTGFVLRNHKQGGTKQ